MNKNKGFIALTLTLSVAGILLILVAASALDALTLFDQALRKEYRALNYYYAGDCLDQGILMLAQDYFFLVTSPLEIPDYNCQIVSVEDQNGLKIITAKGNLQNADVYRRATVRLLSHGLDVIKIE